MIILIIIGFVLVATLSVFGVINLYKQTNKLPDTKPNDEFDKESFQKLAGIIPVDINDEIRQLLVKNNKLNEKVVEQLKNDFENSKFPKPDESMNVRTTKIGTIDTNFGDNDPLASVPMSRISKEAKQKMAEIAKKDIQRQLDEQFIPDSVRESAQKEMDEMNKIVMGTIGSKPKTQTDYQNEHKKPVAKKRKPKTVKQWEDEIDLGGHE
jgi:hypothetical protein